MALVETSALSSRPVSLGHPTTSLELSAELAQVGGGPGGLSSSGSIDRLTDVFVTGGGGRPADLAGRRVDDLDRRGGLASSMLSRMSRNAATVECALRHAPARLKKGNRCAQPYFNLPPANWSSATLC